SYPILNAVREVESSARAGTANASINEVPFTQISLKSGSSQCHELCMLIYFALLCWAKRANSGLVR
ncbi:MAG TPA: hypothetical protein VK775_21995, partial [Chthoniobacterales bacterium]|nr:hypothetical protein [Chthoniobacterales bacterium]